MQIIEKTPATNSTYPKVAALIGSSLLPWTFTNCSFQTAPQSLQTLNINAMGLTDMLSGRPSDQALAIINSKREIAEGVCLRNREPLWFKSQDLAPNHRNFKLPFISLQTLNPIGNTNFLIRILITVINFKPTNYD